VALNQTTRMKPDSTNAQVVLSGLVIELSSQTLCDIMVTKTKSAFHLVRSSTQKEICPHLLVGELIQVLRGALAGQLNGMWPVPDLGGSYFAARKLGTSRLGELR
jgi:hypothetical protein